MHICVYTEADKYCMKGLQPPWIKQVYVRMYVCMYVSFDLHVFLFDGICIRYRVHEVVACVCAVVVVEGVVGVWQRIVRRVDEIEKLNIVRVSDIAIHTYIHTYN